MREVAEELARLSSVSVFFPLYNDAPTVELLARKARETLATLTDDWEIILVNDCSPDRSGEIADRLASEDARIRVIHHERNRGYGGALRGGFAAARKEWVFYTDGDAQYDVAELAKLADSAAGADVVNGYKIQRGDRLYRKFIGQIYHWTAKLLFGLRVRDVDCDFRLIRRRVLQAIPLESDSGVICVELMAKLEGIGARVVEVPVRHYPRIAGRSQFFRFGRITRTLAALAAQWWRLVLCEGRRRVRIPPPLDESRLRRPGHGRVGD